MLYWHMMNMQAILSTQYTNPNNNMLGFSLCERSNLTAQCLRPLGPLYQSQEEKPSLLLRESSHQERKREQPPREKERAATKREECAATKRVRDGERATEFGERKFVFFSSLSIFHQRSDPASSVV